ncbi:MAG: hypothetical protein OEZ04_06845 [Nitrospinota bacterium]|nr:hypothetical protein [Nitrospinota bacterium]
MTVNIKKLALSTVVGGLGMWIVAGVWHNLIMASLYEQVHAKHEGLGVLLLAYFVLALIMAYIYQRGFIGKSPVKDGLIFGAIIGLLWVFPHGLAMAGAHGESIAYVIKNSLWHMVEQGIGGIIIAMVYAKM